jgi:hypothetical protein
MDPSREREMKMTKPMGDLNWHVYGVVITEGDAITGIAPENRQNPIISGEFKFDGRIKANQRARFTREALAGVSPVIRFEVMVMKTTGPVWRAMKPCAQRTYIEDVLEDTCVFRLAEAEIERSPEKGHQETTNKEIAAAAIANSQNVNELEIPDFLKRG